MTKRKKYMEFLETPIGELQPSVDLETAQKLMQQTLRYIKPCKIKKSRV